MTCIFLFPGQGSQKKGMGQDLFPRYRRYVELASDELGYSLERLCLEDPDGLLGRTDYTQPALYTVNALAYYHALESSAERPDMVAGHSLGEYDALLAAGVFDFLTGLKLVKKRGELMAKASKGAMAAVVGLGADRVGEVMAEKGLTALDVANYNSPAQLVLSGPEEDIRKAGPFFEAAGARLYMPLKVSGAFHSRYMAAARAEFEAFLKGFRFLPPRIPVLANRTAKPYRHEDVEANLAGQIDSSVRWVETLEALLAQPDPRFQEIGPGNVLAGLLKQMQVLSQPQP